MEKLKPKSKGHIWLYIILLIAAVGVMLSVKWNTPFKGNGGLESTPGGDTITVGVQYAPPAFYMSHDSLCGIDYELLHMLGMPVKIIPVTTPQEGLDGLERGAFQVLVADLPQQADDNDSFLYTTPAYLDRQVLVQLTDSVGHSPRISSVLDLIGDTVYVTEGSPMLSRIEHISREIGGDIHVTEVPGSSETLLLRQALGAYPLTVVNEQVARAIALDHPRMDYSVQISFTQFQPWMLRADEQKLLKELDHRLDSIKATPAYTRILSRYGMQ